MTDVHCYHRDRPFDHLTFHARRSRPRSAYAYLITLEAQPDYVLTMVREDEFYPGLKGVSSDFLAFLQSLFAVVTFHS